MRIAAALLASLSLGAAAQALQDFRDRVPLALGAKASLHRVQVPEVAYRDGRADLGDLRIFNARGEPVPIALAAEPEPAREALPPRELPAFALTSLEPARIASQVTVRLADGTLVAVDGRGKPRAPERKTVAYILDASTVKDAMSALDIDWEVLPAQETIKVGVEASDDLRTWRRVTGPVTLLRVEQGGRRLEQSRVPLDGLRAKYLRLVAGDTPFTLRSVRAEFQERTHPAELRVKRVAGKPGARPGEVVFDLEARLPVESLRVIPAETNSVIAAGLFVRDAPEGTPSWAAQGTFYRLVRDGAQIESPPMAIRRRAARYWIVRTDPDKGGFGGTLPELEVQWRAAQLVFVARGDEPFTLAFGNPQARSALLPVASVIPAYEPHAEMALPEAVAGKLERTTTMQDQWPAFMQDVPPRKLALWAVLIGAVALLAFMAWRLHASARKP